MAESVYHWQSLAPGHFRLLEVVQTEPNFTISLHSINFEASQEFYAFSYSRGKQSASEAIICDGRVLYLTPHLKEGLAQICKASKQTMFWVDAICINQENETEKAEQVAEIHRIFSKAIAVYAWLGAAAEHSGAVFIALERVSIRDASLPPKPTLDDIARTVLAPRSDDKHKLFPPDLFHPVVDIAQREWFQRLWIAQEYICARSVVFFCGLSSLSGDSLVQAARKFNIWSFGGARPDLSSTVEDLRGFRLLREIHRVRAARGQGQHMSYFDIVMSNRERQTNEPVDRIYGSIGLAEGRDSVYRERLTIYYSEQSRRSYWNLYSRFGQIALLHEPHLRLLEYNTSSRRPDQLPSWCPDLNSQPTTNRFQDGMYSAGGPCRAQNAQGKTCADAHPGFRSVEHSHVQILNASNKISISGARFDVIRKVGSVCDWTDYNEDNLIKSQTFARDAMAWFDDAEQLCMSVIPSSTLAKIVLYRVLNASTVTMDQCRTEAAKDLGDTDAIVYEDTKNLLTRILQLDAQIHERSQFSQLYEQFDLYSHWLNNIASVYEGRVLFTTDGGRIGIGSKDVRIGDVVCMLYSGRLLYVLRRGHEQPDTHGFVSDAYVFDSMKGQIFELLHQGMVHEEDFVLL